MKKTKQRTAPGEERNGPEKKEPKVRHYNANNCLRSFSVACVDRSCFVRPKRRMRRRRVPTRLVFVFGRRYLDFGTSAGEGVSPGVSLFYK